MQDRPEPGKQYALTGKNSIAEGKSWAESEVKPLKQFCKNTTELAIKYFGDDAVGIYGGGKLGMISLLSDVQHFIDLYGAHKDAQHYITILNDIKSVIASEEL